MNQLVFIHRNRPVTDSLTMAAEFGKSHDNIMRDIRNQIDKLNDAGENAFSVLNFEESDYINDRGRAYKKYILTEEGFALVTMSYVTVEAMKFKVKFISEFKEMKIQLLNSTFKLPQSYPEALRALAESEEQKQKIITENEVLTIRTAEQEQKLKEQETPVAIYHLAISAHNTMSMQEVAKSLNTGRTRLYQILRSEGIIMKGSTMPYQRFLDAGYFKVTERPRASGDTIVNDPATRVTAKGFDYIARLMKKRNERISEGLEQEA